MTVRVSSGTYVRALARDLGRVLQVGGHLTALRRTRVGTFDVADAATPGQLEDARLAAPPGVSGLPLLPLAQVTRAVMQGQVFDAETARRIRHGVSPDVSGSVPGVMAAYDAAGRLLAILKKTDERVSVKAVFANEQ